MKWTDRQLDAIESRNQNLLVSAAAGSGKTAVLTERVLRLIDEGATLDRMLIITFTNAAAAEMKQRIAEKTSLSVLDRYNICTFDKFAIDICKKYYHVIDIPPALKICDQYKQDIFRQEAMDELFEDLFESGDEAFRDFLTHYCTAKNNDAARELIFSLYDFLQSMPDPQSWLTALKEKAFDPERLFEAAARQAEEELSDALQQLREAGSLLSEKDGAGALLMPKLYEKNAADTAAVEQAAELFAGGRAEDAASVLLGLEFQRMNAAKAESAYYSEVKDEVNACRGRGKDIIKDIKKRLAGADPMSLEKELALMQPFVTELCILTEDFAGRYAEKKLKANLMDFSDAEHYALNILKDPEVRAELRESFDHIFVDEYQDSNYVQEELVNSISRGDNVFMVGDIKQSIYKFRLAEPEIFLGKYKSFYKASDPRSKVIDLNSNFRSKEPVIDLINRVFSRVMTQSTVGMEYDERAELRAGSGYSGPYVYSPELTLIAMQPGEEDELTGEIESLKAEELEALNAVRVIKKYHGCMINAKDGDRKLRYSDMAILLRSAKNRAEVYYQTLTAHGIPVFLERGEGYFSTPEIRVFLDLLRIIDNPRQDTALITVMHFPSFGFCASELADIKIFGRGLVSSRAFYDILKAFASQEQLEIEGLGSKEGALRAKAADFLGRIAEWRRKGACLPLADFVWQLMHESGIATYAQALPAGAQRIANLRAMADKAASYESETSGGIGGFISYIELIAKSGKVDTGQVRLLTEADDVVRIMTIHKSKGLEFPFVLLAGLGSKLGGPGHSSALRRHRNLGAALKLTDPARGIKATPASFRIIGSVLDGEEYAEDIRVLYVAMTRARDILAMSAAVKNAEDVLAGRGRVPAGRAFMKDYLSMVLPCMPAKDVGFIGCGGLDDAGLSEDGAFGIRQGIEHGFSLEGEELPLSLDELKERLEFSYAPSPESLLKRKYSVSEIAAQRRGETYQTSQAKPKKDGSGLSGAQKGTAYHSVMEHLSFTEGSKSPESIAQFIEELRQKHILSDAEALAVDPERIAAFFSSDIGRRAAASSELHKETPFIMTALLDGRQVLVQGVIDCYFREGDEYVLVDYKSNYVDSSDPEGSAARLLENYRPQLELYREALEGISGVKVKESVLYLFGLDDSAALK